MRRTMGSSVRVMLAAATSCALAGGVGLARAGSFTWTGQGASPFWNLPANWSGGVVPAAGTDTELTFSTPGHFASAIQNIANPFTLSRLTFGGGSIQLAGQPLRFDAPSLGRQILTQTSSPIWITQPVTYRNYLTFTGSNPGSHITLIDSVGSTDPGARVEIATPGTVELLGGGNIGGIDFFQPGKVTVAGIANAMEFGLSVLDGGQAQIFGTSTQFNASQMRVMDGTLTVSSAAVSSSDLLLGDFNSDFTSTMLVDQGARVSIAHDVEVSAWSGSTARLTVNDLDTVLNASNLSVGIGSSGTGGAVGYLDIGDGAAVNVSGITTLNRYGSALSIYGGSLTTGGLNTTGLPDIYMNDPAGGGYALTVGANDASSELATIITGSGSLRKVGSGTLTIGLGMSDYVYYGSFSGRTTVDGGTLLIRHTDQIGAQTLSVNSAGARAVLEPGRLRGLIVDAVQLTNGGLIDLNDNDLDVKGGSREQIQAYILAARNGGAWDGAGITSSTARTDPNHATTLGLLSGSEYTSETGTDVFSGRFVSANDKLIKYTYYGDTDFNGLVNFDDYVRTDNGFNNALTGWLNGDFDYNGVVNFDDYVLIDLAFNTQNGTLRRAMAFVDGSDRSEQGMTDPALQAVRDHVEQFGEAYAQHFAAAVPEPASLALIGVPAAGMALRRRRR